MKKPMQLALEIVDQFSWSSNVSRDGKLVGQQYVVAEAIAAAIEKERARYEPLRCALVDTTVALNGIRHSRLTPKGRTARAATDKAMAAFDTFDHQ